MALHLSSVTARRWLVSKAICSPDHWAVAARRCPKLPTAWAVADEEVPKAPPPPEMKRLNRWSLSTAFSSSATSPSGWHLERARRRRA